MGMNTLNTRRSDYYNHVDTKMVRFDVRNNKVREIPSIDDLSDEEYKALWLAPEEFLRIRKRERKLLERLNFVGNTGPSDSQFGLESQDEKKEKYELIHSAVTSVLGEQQRQVYLKECDPERIAMLYSRISEGSSSKALERAFSVRSQLQAKPNRQSRRMSMPALSTTQHESSFAISPPTSPGTPSTPRTPRRHRPLGLASRNRKLEMVLKSPCHQRWQQTGVPFSTKKDCSVAPLCAPNRPLLTPQQKSSHPLFSGKQHIELPSQISSAIATPLL